MYFLFVKLADKIYFVLFAQTRSLKRFLSQIVQEECDGKQTCTIGAYNFIFGDPCSGRGKYLSATWECLAVSKPLSEGPSK